MNPINLKERVKQIILDEGATSVDVGSRGRLKDEIKIFEKVKEKNEVNN